MEKNEINIINDLDRENDDLMIHLGILQQFSLGQKTNVLKNIKSYTENIPENNEINNISKEETNFQKLESEQDNKNDLFNEDKEKNFNNLMEDNELDMNKIKQNIISKKIEPEENKNEEIKNFDKNEINNDYNIFKNNKKLLLNLTNKNLQNQNENIPNKSENINNNDELTNSNFNEEKNEIDIDNKEFDSNIFKEENNLFKNDFNFQNKKFIYKKEEENIKNKEIIDEIEKEKQKSNIKIINQEKKNDNFVCDLDIFKKLQIQMNKKSEILQKTLDKYNHKPKKFEIINDSKLNHDNYSNYSKEQNLINENIKDKNNINKNSIGIDINDLNEKMSSNTKNLLEKINRIKNNIEKNNNPNISNNKYNKINKLDMNKDLFIKKEIKEAQSSYEPLIFRIPSLLLDDKIEEIEIYIKLEMIYYNLKTITSKLDFISLLRQVLNNVIMLKNSSFNVYMTLFNFILNLQIYELNLSDCNPSLPCEYLKSLLDLLVNNKELTDMIRIIIVLIKKYFPVNMGIILEQKNIVTLKVLNSYLKQLNNAILSAYINIKSVFIEVNDFLFFSPPSLLSDEYPLAELYMEIYEEIRNTTDNVIKSCKGKMMKNELMDAVVFIKSKVKNSSFDYIKYLDYAIYKIN